jgi:hypothetical protein
MGARRVHLEKLPRMADFALWATACEPALWPAGTFARAYAANRRAAIESVIEADPVATRVRPIMATWTMWTRSASDLLRLCADGAREELPTGGWARSPRALAGRLRRTQTCLRMLSIEIAFRREDRAGTRMIRVSTRPEDITTSSDSPIGAIRSNGSRSDQAIRAGLGD